MGSVLSVYLYQLARERSPEGRRRFATAMTEMVSSKFPDMRAEERAIAFDILERTIHDLEMSLRKTLSECLAKTPNVPRVLAKLLANDSIEVAYPILTMSDALLDEDLIEVIRNRTYEHQLAVTLRPSLTEEVSDALVATGREGVIRGLLLNPNARISSATIQYLVEESRRNDSYQQPLLGRSDLPSALAQRMFGWVSTALRQYILDNYRVDPEYVNQVLEKAVAEEIKAARGSGNRRPSQAQAVVQQLDKDGKVDLDLLVRALKEGEVPIFLALFERLTRLDSLLVMRLMQERDGNGLAVACRAAALGKAHFADIFACCRIVDASRRAASAADIRHVLAFYDRVTREAAIKVVRAWWRGEDYGSALSELELA